MTKNKILLLATLILPAMTFAAGKTVYDVKAYGAVDSPVEYSTGAIQKAIDAASEAGGGQVHVPAGTYLISPIQLKSDVELYLAQGALLLGTTDRSRYDIPKDKNMNKAGERGLVWSSGAKNISIKGKGSIDGQGEGVATNAGKLIAEGSLADGNAAAVKKRYEEAGHFRAEWPRPEEGNRPMLIALYDSENVALDGIQIKNSASWTTTLWRCRNVVLSNLTVVSVNFWNNDGINLMDCKDAVIRGCNVNSADDGICLKSHDYDQRCENITIEQCTIRSSASAIKFGTASKGGFRNVTIRDIRVRDTFRSAIALEAVDGGDMDNVKISNIKAVNTWNAIFIVAGTRDTRNRVSAVRNITIENVTCQVPATQPDLDYPFATKRKLSNNLYPSLITGSPSSTIENVSIKNLKVTFAGGGTTAKASSSVDDLDRIMDGRYNRYPEYDMFGELPAWGMLCRNINGLRLENVQFVLQAEDYRTPVVIDNVQKVMIKNLKVAGERKTPVVLRRSTIKSVKGIVSPDNSGNSGGKMYEIF
ncbi:exo-poly-alpha-D-galacturonosidase [Bacteroidia bacterium]|nr:exo-poly-alpha-D-galacturonosidase [Bacteroidia bacterium]